MQLSAWTSSTEKTVIAAADAQEALPELSNEASGGGASKGFQQITGWQVQRQLTLCLVAGALSASQLLLSWCGPKTQGGACARWPTHTYDLLLEVI